MTRPNEVAVIAALLLCATMLGCAPATHPPPAVTSSATSHRSPTLAEARRGIEEGYRRNRDASLAKDIKAMMALRTDDFHSITPDGKSPRSRRDGGVHGRLSERGRALDPYQFGTRGADPRG